MTLETSWQLHAISKSGFAENDSMAIHLPTSIEMLCERCFSFGKSFASATSESDSNLHKRHSLVRFGIGVSAFDRVSATVSRPVLCGREQGARPLRPVIIERT
jgi:hypothetical protein